jgi:hypothetical protein
VKLARLLAAAALFAAAHAGPAAAAGRLVAEQIEEATFAELSIGGQDAVGGVGDWYLGNDVVEIVVDDPSRRYGVSPHGGTIVDAGRVGQQGDDQFARLFPLVNMDQRVQLGLDRARAEVDPAGGFARLVVTGSGGLRGVPRGGELARRFDALVPETREIERVFAETVYEVRPGEPFVRITTRLENRGDAPAPVFAYGEVWMRGGRSLRSFVGNTLAPERSRGFHHLSFDRANILGASEAMAPYTFVALPGMAGHAPIAYALYSPERARRGRVLFGVTGEHVTLANVFLRDPEWDELGLLRLLRATRDELPAGETFSWERRLLVSEGPDVASATDVIFPDLGFAAPDEGLAGRIEPPDTRVSILVARSDGAPVTQMAPATRGPDAGRFGAVLPPGDYVLTLRAEQRPPRRLEATVAAGRTSELPAQRFEPPGFLRFEQAFADGGPGRMVVTGLGQTPDPVFAPELLDFRVDGEPAASGSETRDLHFIGSARDPRRLALPPGRYRLTATRGPEFALEEREVEIPEGGEVALAPFDLERLVRVRGALSADLHVHAEASDDSGMGNEARLASFAAEFVDVMVSTDHEVLGGYEPALDATGLRGRLHVRQGVEVTNSGPSPEEPWTAGHHNAWPLAYRPTAHRRGAPPSFGVGVADLYARLRGEFGAKVVQLNHALKGDGERDDEAYLSHLGASGVPFDPSLPLEAEPNRALLAAGADGETRPLDFDAMEVMNGSKFAQYLRLREAWYSLQLQGVRRTATGNSDSHGPGELAGYPRNYVLAGETPDADAAFDAALREGQSFVTTGPLVTAFRANGGGLGDTVAAPDGRVEVQLAVSAPAWIPVDEVRLLANGEVVRRFTHLAPPENLVRILRSETLALAGDALLTLEAGAPLDADPDAWQRERGGVYAARVAPGFVAQALTNPIFVDVDGNGRFDAPGLPAAASAAAARLPLGAAAILLLLLAWWWLRRRVTAREPGPGRSPGSGS